ncbi:unnamed protein product [Nippostrongylus brasiliensis]|uniref:Ovule protein n=1 Tax=Nippostrongylus brasiliensis TaxID=27835 RepID=A0A0N4Y0B1_NIPBR|nr:unnamed protein product [Nippostrongylus brasiliensis]
MVLKNTDDVIELANSKQNKLTSGLLNEKAELKVLLDDEKAGCGELKRKLADVKGSYEIAVHRLDEARQELELVSAILERTQEELGVDDFSSREWFEKSMTHPSLSVTSPKSKMPRIPDELEERSEAHSEEEQQVNQQVERQKRALMLELERCRTRKVELEHAIAQIPDR